VRTFRARHCGRRHTFLDFFEICSGIAHLLVDRSMSGLDRGLDAATSKPHRRPDTTSSKGADRDNAPHADKRPVRMCVDGIDPEMGNHTMTDRWYHSFLSTSATQDVV
jgi:hypothetical protein